MYTTYNEIIKEIKSRTNLTTGVKSEIGDILIPCSTTTTGIDLANATLINEPNILIGGDITILRLKEKGIPAYFTYLLNHCKKRDIAKYSQGSTIIHLYFNHFKQTLLHYPKSLPEQQKIADCLSSLDDLITAEKHKFEDLQKHKKGLMQKLFPAENQSVPELRFSEFRGEWEERKLGEIAEIIRGASPRPINNFLTKDKDSLNWLKIGDINKESKYITRTKEKILRIGLSKTREVNPGDLIMSNSMSFGRPYILKIKTCIHDGWIVFTKIDINIDFLYYLILSNKSQSYFLKTSAGSTVKNLSIDIIKALSSSFPSLPEQQKIADCFSSLDDLISAQKKKIELLQKHKKGLMQGLFPTTA